MASHKLLSGRAMMILPNQNCNFKLTKLVRQGCAFPKRGKKEDPSKGVFA
jgi:hypothetical protein